jgi:hypothetical protein
LNERSASKPPIVPLKEAIRNIVETRNRPTKPVANPFVFVAGAGISYPSVPLAGWITKECEKLARGKGVNVGPKSDSPIDRYSHWFEKAYPDPTARQEYIQRLVQAKPISPANFRLAHLLIEGFTNLVITPNFDTFLSRALRIFGHDKFRVCDHPATTARITPELGQTQIVHVHGTFQFYDVVNLKGELENRARFTMARLLDDIFRDRVPIVIGYSGWDGDVITKALKRRLEKKDSPLPYTLYWFCHSTCPSLDWLVSKSGVRFVAPDEGATLSAEQILDELIREMGCKEPELARRPVRFLAEQLRESVPKGKDQADPYSLRSVAARLHRAAELEEAEFTETNRYMERVRSFLRTSKYHEAAEAIIAMPFDMLNYPQLEELLGQVELIAPYISEPSRRRLLHMRTLADDRLRRKDWAMLQDDMFWDEPGDEP